MNWHMPSRPARQRQGQQRVGECKESLVRRGESCIEPKTTVIISQPGVEEGVIHCKKGVLRLDKRTINQVIDKSVLIVINKNKREKHYAMSYKGNQTSHRNLGTSLYQSGFMSYRNAETGYVEQVGECSPSMHKVLGLIPTAQLASQYSEGGG